LGMEIAAGRFRADLYYRISVLQVKLPNLGERREDVPVLAEYFRTFYQRQFAKECGPLGPKLLKYLENLHWRGNIRELSNCMARFVLIGNDAFTMTDGEPTRKHPALAEGMGDGVPLKNIAKNAIREMERNVILEALRTNQWNRRKAAEALKISYRALIYKIRDAGLGSRRSGIAPTGPGQSSIAQQSVGD
jgi:two-component system, NtrC family, response regulator AtoC